MNDNPEVRKYMAMVEDEAVRRHANGTVCEAKSPATCPENRKAEAGDRVEQREKTNEEKQEEFRQALRLVSIETLSRVMKKYDDDKHPLYMKLIIEEIDRREQSYGLEEYMNSLGERA